MNNDVTISSNFIKNIIINDLKTNKCASIITRFPPEPNGYLHIGHAKAICLNFGLAIEFNGKCNLRLDDTNPEKEHQEYVDEIIKDIKWLGFKWADNVKYASDYFDKLYEFAIFFIKQNLAYVCDLSLEQIRDYRGDFNNPGTNSPYRDRTVDENLKIFEEMRNGIHPDGSKTLRLKIDMSSSNINLRDPAIYRIKKTHHIRTKDKWCIYPLYDYTHCISDALEGITHSFCSLEFENHRPLYDYILTHLYNFKLINCLPKQTEFSRLELLQTITSKRKLNQLVVSGDVDGWDDPRMPTISGMRRRGYTAEGIKLFVSRCGISKAPNVIDYHYLESTIREDLESKAIRVMAILDPIKIIFTNFSELVNARVVPFHADNEQYGSRTIKLNKEIFIEKQDFMEVPINNWHRLSLGEEVRLRYSYVIKCNNVVKDNTGKIIELICSIDYDTLGKNPANRKVKGVIHWVNVSDSIPSQFRIYDRLTVKNINDEDTINPNSLTLMNGYIEPSILNFSMINNYQFERLGYFIQDCKLSTPQKLVFNSTVSLKDVFKVKNDNIS